MQRKTAVIIITLDVLLSLVIFGVQAYQIHTLNSQQTQLNRQQSAIVLNAVKNDCWSGVLDKALKSSATSAIKPAEKAQLIKQAHKCAQLPTVPVTVSGQVIPSVGNSGR